MFLFVLFCLGRPDSVGNGGRSAWVSSDELRFGE